MSFLGRQGVGPFGSALERNRGVRVGDLDTRAQGTGGTYSGAVAAGWRKSAVAEPAAATGALSLPLALTFDQRGTATRVSRPLGVGSRPRTHEDPRAGEPIDDHLER